MSKKAMNSITAAAMEYVHAREVGFDKKVIREKEKALEVALAPYIDKVVKRELSKPINSMIKQIKKIKKVNV